MSQISLPKDQNNVTALGAALDSDGETVVAVLVDPAFHILKVNNNTTGSDNGRLPAVRDDNQVPVLMATSSADGVSPVEVYADSSGRLLIDGF